MQEFEGMRDIEERHTVSGNHASHGGVGDATGAGGAGTVLIVEDERSLATIISGYFIKEGFDTVLVGDGLAAVEQARRSSIRVIILDLGLPGIDGVEVCRRIRTFSNTYILMLTARVEEVDELIGLSVGADDYLTKPFSPRVLVARVKTLLRRPRRQAGEEARRSDAAGGTMFGDIGIDVPARTVTRSGRAVELTKTEFDVLSQLTSQPGRVFTRDQLMDAVWGSPNIGDDQLVDVHIGHLRKKLGAPDDSGATIIQTVRGVGYRFDPERTPRAQTSPGKVR